MQRIFASQVTSGPEVTADRLDDRSVMIRATLEGAGIWLNLEWEDARAMAMAILEIPETLTFNWDEACDDTRLQAAWDEITGRVE